MTWGLAEFVAAEEFHRFRGYWWAPDGRSVLAARVDESRRAPLAPARPGATRPARRPPSRTRTPAGRMRRSACTCSTSTAAGSTCTGTGRPTRTWSPSSWSETGGPLITVLRRLQQHGLVLAVDPRTGETQVHAELADPRWVEPVAGTPAHLPRRPGAGRRRAGPRRVRRPVPVRRRQPAHPAHPVRAAGGGRLPAGDGRRPDRRGAATASRASSTCTGSARRPAVGGAEARRITTTPGWHVAHGRPATRWSSARCRWSTAACRYRVYARGERDRASCLARRRPAVRAPAGAGTGDRPAAADRRCCTRASHVAGRRLPVLVDIYGGPGHQEVVAARSRWLERQWWADAGFAVVAIDNRGTPGVAPSFEKAIHRRFADVILTDQVDALPALADKHTDLDLSRVAIRGWSFGGWLAALAVLRRPERVPLRGGRRAGHRLGALRHRVHRAVPGAAGRRQRRVRAQLAAGDGRRAAGATRPTPGRCCWYTGWSTTTWSPRTRCACRPRCWPPAGRTR